MRDHQSKQQVAGQTPDSPVWRISRRRALRTGVPILIAIAVLGTLAWTLPRTYPAFFADLSAGCNPPASWYAQQGQTASANVDQGQIDDALAAYGRAVQADPRCGPAYAGQATAYQRAGRYSDALSSLNSAIGGEAQSGNRTTAALYAQRGAVEHAMHDDQSAMNDFEHAILLCPGCEDGYIDQGNMYLDQGHLTAALEDYSKAIASAHDATTPRLDEALFDRGKLYEWIGDQQHALADFNRLMPADPKLTPDPDVLYERAQTYDSIGDKTGALADYTSFLKLADPADFRTAHARQRVQALQGG